jgi:hypothetical protein
MAERAAHLVDHIFPDVPVRQWVWSLPHRLRYLLAWDHDLCRAVSGVAVRAVLGSSGAARVVTASPLVGAAPWWSCSASVGR